MSSRLSRPFRKYLEGRNFDPEHIQELWKIQTLGITTHLKWRIWIPIYHHAQLVSWTTRAIGLEARGPRYITAPPKHETIHHKELLYGEDFCRHAIIVCEGPLDAWRIGPGAVATFGTSVTPAQILKISKYPMRAICFDAEPEARKRARALRDQLLSFPGVTLRVELESGLDAADMNEKEVKTLRKEILG